MALADEIAVSGELPPILKWAGGKRWLVHKLAKMTGRFERYIEPFAGGAALFFALRPTKACLSDLNPRLINVYVQVRDDPERVQEWLLWHQTKHGLEHYYSERAKSIMSGPEEAARFIYLNRTCWNGLFRLNKSGVFNVPIGTKSKIAEDSMEMQRYSQILEGVDLSSSDFEEVIDSAIEGDFIFADPPYTVKHNSNGFLKYNESMFSWGDQVRLAEALHRAANRGCKVIATNANHQSVRDLYSEISEFRQVFRHSVISGKSKYRAKTSELMIEF